MISPGGMLAAFGTPAYFRRLKRQRTRQIKRLMNATRYAEAGLNGKRAVARRKRQIEAGQLRVTV